MREKIKAVILAAGKGERLSVITESKPKPMISIAGKPILEYLLESLKELGIVDFLIVVGYKSDSIINYFGDGTSHGVHIEYVYQEKALGTADALKKVKDKVRSTFLVVYGDLLISTSNICRILDAYYEDVSDFNMAVVELERTSEFGYVELSGKYIERVIEKPEITKGGYELANAGIYIFHEDIFEFVEKTALSRRGEYELTDSINLAIENGRKIRAIRIQRSGWIDIGRPWDLLKACEYILTHRKLAVTKNSTIERGATLTGKVGIGECVRIKSGAYIEGPAYIDSYSVIGPNCYIRPYTSIGKNVRIGNACEIKNSVIQDNTRIEHLSYVGDSIIGEGCNLGAGTILANLRLDNKTVKVEIKGKTIDTKLRKFGGVVGDYVKIGVNSSIMPGVIIGQYSRIWPNSLVTRNIPPMSIFDGKSITKLDESSH